MWEQDQRILSELIAEGGMVRPEMGEYGRPKITLIETGEALPYGISLQSVPANIFVVKSDGFPAPTTIFRNLRQECKRADYLMLVEQGQQKYAIFLELKGGNAPNTEIIAQLKGSLGLLSYCRKIGQVFWEQENFLRGYGVRFVTIKHIPRPRLEKRAIRYRKNQPLAQVEPIAGAVANVPNQLVIFRHQKDFYFGKFLQGIGVNGG